MWACRVCLAQGYSKGGEVCCLHPQPPHPDEDLAPRYPSLRWQAIPASVKRSAPLMISVMPRHKALLSPVWLGLGVRAWEPRVETAGEGGRVAAPSHIHPPCLEDLSQFVTEGPWRKASQCFPFVRFITVCNAFFTTSLSDAPWTYMKVSCSKRNYQEQNYIC